LNGWVDQSRRAPIDVQVACDPADPPKTITVWIDTAFDGFLVFSQALIAELQLPQEALTQAVLADGSEVILESYLCHILWFGDVAAAQVIANDGRLPLLGTELLASRKLIVDYAAVDVLID